MCEGGCVHAHSCTYMYIHVAAALKEIRKLVHGSKNNPKPRPILVERYTSRGEERGEEGRDDVLTGL